MAEKRREDRRKKSKTEAEYSGPERRKYNRRIGERIKDVRKEIKREHQRDRFLEALKKRIKAKEKASYLSIDRILIKHKKQINEALSNSKLTDDERIRLAREIALLYQLDLHKPAKEQLSLWNKEKEVNSKGNFNKKNTSINKNYTSSNKSNNFKTPGNHYG